MKPAWSFPLLFWTLIAMIIGQRLVVLVRFSARFVGNDDMIYWQGAADYAQGIFREPFFYGQDYNFMIEALLAVPLLKLGVPLWWALPVVTSLCILFPFLFAAFLFRRHGHETSAILFLLALLLVPVEYELLTGMSRGFVQGMLIAGFLVVPLLHRRAGWAPYATMAIGGFAFIANPNSLLVSLPIAVIVWMPHVRDVHAYPALLAVGPALLLQEWARAFYVTHPDHVMHPRWRSNFSFERLAGSFEHLDRYFEHVVPVLWKGGWVLLPMLLVGSALAWRHHRVLSMAQGAVLLLLLVMLGEKKVDETVGTVMLSSGRFFLGLPLVVALLPACVLQGRTLSSRGSAMLLGLALFAMAGRMALLGPAIQEATRHPHQHYVGVVPVDELRATCDRLTDMIESHRAQALVVVPGEGSRPTVVQQVACGCPLINGWQIPSVMSTYERRTWLFNEVGQRTFERVMIHGALHEEWEDPPELMRLDDRTAVLTGNDKSTRASMLSLGYLYQRIAD